APRVRAVSNGRMSGEAQGPVVPETLEGWAVLHDVVSLDRASWNRLDAERRATCLNEAIDYLSAVSKPAAGSSALYTLLGHKGDFLLLHFRPDFVSAHEAELGFRSLCIGEYLQPPTSYVS